MAGAGECSLFQNMQTGSGAHPASYSKGAKGFFPQSSSDLNMKLAAGPHPVPRLGMTGTVLLLILLLLLLLLLLPAYIFREWSWTPITLALCSF